MGYHDIFFKHTFSKKENAIDFTHHILPPDLDAKIDYSTICMENASYVDKLLSESFSDTVYSCKFGKAKIKIAILFEHKSHPDKNLPCQLNRYMLNIWDTNIKQKLPKEPVLPIVLYHGKESWNPEGLESCFHELPSELKKFIPDFEYIFVDLSCYSDKEIKDKIFTLASLKISLLILKNIFDQKKLEDNLNEFFKIGRFYFQNDKGLKFLESVIKYILGVTDMKTEKVVKAIKPINFKGEEIVMTTAERLRQEGLQEGLKKGMKEGLKKGMKEGSYKTFYSVIKNARKNGIADDKIAKMLNMRVSFVEKILNNEKVEIPLNLL